MARFAVPVGLLAFCAIAFWLSTQFDRVPPILLRGMQPEHFPQLVVILIAALAVCVMVFDPVVEQQRRPARMVWISMGLFAVFALLAQVDLFLGLGVFAGALALCWGERRPWALALVAVVGPAFVFFLFDQVFEIRFPRGLLTNLWYG